MKWLVNLSGRLFVRRQWKIIREYEVLYFGRTNYIVIVLQDQFGNIKQKKVGK